jgi:hypothetical protein
MTRAAPILVLVVGLVLHVPYGLSKDKSRAHKPGEAAREDTTVGPMALVHGGDDPNGDRCHRSPPPGEDFRHPHA